MRVLSNVGVLVGAVLLLGCGSSDSNATGMGNSGGSGNSGGNGGSDSGTGASAGSGGSVGGFGGGSLGGNGGVGASAGTSGTPNPKLANLGAGDAMDLGAFECTTPSDVCSRVTDYSGFVFDSVSHRFLMFGGGHSTTMTDAIFAFDLEGSLTWKELHEPTPCSMMVASNLDATKGAWVAGNSGPYPRPLAVHTYDLLGFAPAQNEFVLISRLFSGGYCNTTGNDVGGPVAHFGLSTGSWSFSDAQSGSAANIDASEYDPVSGRILIFGRSGIGFYDPALRTNTLLVSSYDGDKLKNSQGTTVDFGALGYANHMVYFPPTDTFYYFVRGNPVGVFALKLDRANPKNSILDEVSTKGPSSPHTEPGYAYDSKNQIIGGAVTDSTFYAFDPATSTWSAHPIAGSPGSQAFHALGYDPLNNVFIFVTDYDSGAKTWAYRLAG
ncbi:MAG: hypothetical protein R3B13_20125 [Polyangiaceae bacterium]